jgi:hypothetical protein
MFESWLDARQAAVASSPASSGAMGRLPG